MVYDIHYALTPEETATLQNTIAFLEENEEILTKACGYEDEDLYNVACKLQLILDSVVENPFACK